MKNQARPLLPQASIHHHRYRERDPWRGSGWITVATSALAKNKANAYASGDFDLPAEGAYVLGVNVATAGTPAGGGIGLQAPGPQHLEVAFQSHRLTVTSIWSAPRRVTALMQV